MAGSDQRASERRRSQRATLEVPVDYSTVDTFFAEFSANMNEGGMFIETDAPGEPEMAVQLAFRIPGTDDPVKVEGRVAWVSDGTAGQPRGMGIEFLALSAEVREQIDTVVRRLRGT
jgi:type IV pilus assembly protein PilZ